MEWDLKMPPASWELADELENSGGGGVPPAAAVAASSAAVGGVNVGGGGRQECSVDLKLGGLGDKCRDYHRRHKVCEAHSKTPLVVVSGREMRFCQQCSRFHLLAEFDEAKRSCRKRLDGHNRRRRKPQPDPMNSASYLASQQGARFSPFSTPRPEASWTGMIKTEESPYYTHHQIPLAMSRRQQHFVGSTSDGGRRFPFLQEGEISFGTGTGGVPMDQAAAAASVCQPLLKTVAPPPPHDSGGSGSGSKMFSDGGLTQVLDSDCALSLLSAPANSSAIDVGGGRMVVQPTEHIPIAQPLISGLQFGGGSSSSSSAWFTARPHHQPATGAAVVVSTAGFSCPVVESEQLNTVLTSNDNEMNYNGMFHVGGEGSSDGTSSSLPFSWQ
uniref:SBP-type domain-containing protein n=1 Tax=Oryza punctata TaxID=4537 RepID=A0A0E0LX94_ORYPU